MNNENIKKYDKAIRKANFGEALFTFISLVIIMFVSIIKYGESPHIPMLIGVLIASLVALKIGYSWKFIENSMIKVISQAMQSIIILAIIGVLVGVWILSGVVPTMIYYGLLISQQLSRKCFVPFSKVPPRLAITSNISPLK